MTQLILLGHFLLEWMSRGTCLLTVSTVSNCTHFRQITYYFEEEVVNDEGSDKSSCNGRA